MTMQYSLVEYIGFWNINNYTLFCISSGENSAFSCFFVLVHWQFFLKKSVSLHDSLSFKIDWPEWDPPMPLLPDLYVKDFLLRIFPVVCGWLQFILFFELHAIVHDNVQSLSLKTLHWNIFPGNQFCSYVFFTKIIFVFASEFFEFKSKDFIQGDYKSIKNLKKNRKYFSLSLKIYEIHQVSARNSFRRQRKITSHFVF